MLTVLFSFISFSGQRLQTMGHRATMFPNHHDEDRPHPPSRVQRLPQVCAHLQGSTRRDSNQDIRRFGRGRCLATFGHWTCSFNSRSLMPPWSSSLLLEFLSQKGMFKFEHFKQLWERWFYCRLAESGHSVVRRELYQSGTMENFSQVYKKTFVVVFLPVAGQLDFQASFLIAHL